MPESFDYKEAPDVQMLGEPGGPVPSRRGILFWFGAALNVLVGLLVAVPIIGYVFSSWKRDDWQAWVDLVAYKAIYFQNTPAQVVSVTLNAVFEQAQ